MPEGIKIRAVSKKAKRKKKRLVRLTLFLRRWMPPLHMIEPFMLILAFVIVTPTLLGTPFAWLFALCAFEVAMRVVTSDLEEIFKDEIKTEDMIEENNIQISHLQSDIKRLRRKMKRQKKLNKQLEKLKGGFSRGRIKKIKS
ncbi:MAG: hypothetical protein ABSG05_03570 [Candidatus Pacearchaeota archaeon]|jgi:hypothetical protein